MIKIKVKTVYDLSTEQLDELRESLYQQYLDDGTINADEFAGVPDDILYDHFSGVTFTDDDFFCTTEV